MAGLIIISISNSNKVEGGSEKHIKKEKLLI